MLIGSHKDIIIKHKTATTTAAVATAAGVHCMSSTVNKVLLAKHASMNLCSDVCVQKCACIVKGTFNAYVYV